MAGAWSCLAEVTACCAFLLSPCLISAMGLTYRWNEPLGSGPCSRFILPSASTLIPSELCSFHVLCRNPGGVRFGSAEIYDVLDLCFSAQREGVDPADAVVQDCLAVGQAIQGGADERVILFVQLTDGTTLTPALEGRIRAEIRKRRSARHVPARVRQRCCLFLLFYLPFHSAAQQKGTD